MTETALAKKEGRMTGAIRIFLEQPRSDEETVAYLAGWHDAAAFVRSTTDSQRGNHA